MNIIDEYFKLFGDLPPIFMTISDTNEKYLKLVEKAVRTKTPLTENDLEKNFKNYDTKETDKFDEEDPDDELTD